MFSCLRKLTALVICPGDFCCPRYCKHEVCTRIRSSYNVDKMSVYHDEVEIEDFEYDEEDEMYYYPCPCGDRFQISKVCELRGYVYIP